MIPSASVPPGGAETQILLVSRELAKLGFRVGLVAYADPRLPTEFEGARVIARPRPRGKAGLARKLREIGTIWQTLSRVQTRVIVRRVHGEEVGIVALHSRLHRRRFVYSSANVIDMGARSGLDSWATIALHHFGLMIATAIVVQTNEQKELCRRNLHRQAELIGSIAELAPATEPSSPEAFLWVGRVVPYKRPLAYVRLAQALPDHQFWMIVVPGTQEPDALWRETCESAKRTSNVRLLPTVRRDELGALIARAIAVVNTSEYEGMPNVFLEGWARGVPALALSYDPDSVITTHGLGEFAAGSEPAMLAAAQRLAAGDPSRSRLAKQCRRYVQEYHAPAAVAGRWVDVLRLATPPSSDRPARPPASAG